MDDFQFTDPRHERIYKKLQFIGPGPAAFFEDALKIMFDNNYVLKSEVHLVSHIFREIESAVRDAIRRPEEKIDGHKNDINYILKKLDIPLDHPAGEAWMQFADQDFDFQFNKLVHRQSLLNPRQRQKEIEDSWEDFMDILDLVVDKAQQNYFDAVHTIDDLLEKEHPTEADARILVGNTPQNQTTLSYLFDQCDNPVWTPLLRDKGFFRHPPPTIYNDDGSWRYPPWPAGKFIQKMAPEKPDDISEIIQEVPETDNLSAIDDMVYALGSLPPAIAVQHCASVTGWMDKGSLSYRAEPYIEYVFLLAKNDFREESLTIIKKLLLPELPDDSEEEFGLGRSISYRNLKISDYEFRTLFNEHIQSLLAHFGFELIKLLTDILDDVLTYSYADPPADMSHMWKQQINIEDPDYTGYRHEVKETLVDAIASSTDYLITEGSITVQDAGTLFGSHNWAIFQRLSALLYSRHESMEDIRNILLDKDNFEEYSIRFEYRLLLDRHYPSLTEDEQKTILQWIKKGPNREDVAQFLEQRDVEPTGKEIAAYIERWQRRKLFPISEYLEEDWKEYYKELIEEHGEPDFETSGVRSFVGPTTPKTIPELKELTVQQLIDYLQSWQPEDGFAKPTPEGLGRALHSVIADKADEVSQYALSFNNLEPTYVRALFEGLRTAIKNEAPIHWEPVLELAEWVLQRPLDEPKDEIYRSKDPSWSWTRGSIANVLKKGCYAKSHGIPFQYRGRVWDCLAILVEDPDPDDEKQLEQAQNNRNPANLSINTTRGKAMHTVFAYGWWAKNHLKGKDEDNEFSFDDMPEVQTVLENHLDLDHDPSLAIRSVYGQHLTDLFGFDKEWLEDNLHQIFPLEEDSQSYFIAAWDAYIGFTEPYDNIFEIMAPIYEQALNLIDEEAFGKHLRSDQKFVQHLIVLYWREVIVPEQKYSDLLQKFWEDAPDKLRKHAFEFTGRCLRRWQQTTEPEIAESMQSYIELRIDAAKEADEINHYKKELAGFGWCFESNALDKGKRIQYLIEILHLTGKVDQSHSVMETLNNEFTDEYPEEVLECIELMVKGTDRNLSFYGWKSDLKDIFQSLLDKKDTIAERTSGLIQYICQKDYHLMQEFKPLLN